LNTPPRRPRDPREAYVTEEQLERILSATGARMILIGGQALAFWAAYYRVPPPTIAITKDVDLLALPSRDVDPIGSNRVYGDITNKAIESRAVDVDAARR